jgi:hypothetical protein
MDIHNRCSKKLDFKEQLLPKKSFIFHSWEYTSWKIQSRFGLWDPERNKPSFTPKTQIYKYIIERELTSSNDHLYSSNPEI